MERPTTALMKTVLDLLDLVSHLGDAYKGGRSIENKQLLLRFLFKELKLKEGNVGYTLNAPFCYMEADDAGSNTTGGQNDGSCEPQSGQGVEGNLTPILSNLKNTSCEPQNMLEKQEVRPQNLTSVQSGWRHRAVCELNLMIIFYVKIISSSAKL